MNIPNVTLSPGAVISAHAVTLNETLVALVNARSCAAQWELEATRWKERADQAEAEVATLKAAPTPQATKAMKAAAQTAPA